MPVLILFYQSNGLSLEHALGVQAIYSLMIAVWEIPSGYLSDRWGRRPSLLLGMSLLTAQFVILSIATGFWGFAAGVVLGGIGSSFISGTDSAMLYETLKAQGKEALYSKREGRLYSIGNISEATAAIVGGILASVVALRLPIAVQSVFSAVGLWAAFRLVEPPKEPKSNKHRFFSDIWRILRQVILGDRQLFLWLCLSAVVGSASHVLAWTTQPYLKTTWHWDEWAIGLAWSGLNLSVALLSWWSYRIYAGRSQTAMAIGFLCALAVGYLALALAWWAGSAVAFVVLAFTFAVRGAAAPFFKDVINTQTPSDARATVLSVREFFVRMLYVLVAPILGYVGDCYSLELAFMLQAVFILIVGTVIFLLLGRVRRSF